MDYGYINSGININKAKNWNTLDIASSPIELADKIDIPPITNTPAPNALLYYYTIFNLSFNSFITFFLMQLKFISFYFIN